MDIKEVVKEAINNLESKDQYEQKNNDLASRMQEMVDQNKKSNTKQINMYTEKQLVEFGNYILSSKNVMVKDELGVEIYSDSISHADICNFNGLQMSDKVELTFGQKAVGLRFNPSGDNKVDLIKQKFAEIIDVVNDAQPETYLGNQIRGEAMRTAMDAQMWAVKLLTWKD